ncbi:MAG: Asp-tRNA(Asn)/Glu-tRNA(Gln) amidotransferase subunit GatC [Oscillospiraceae bacterium]|jgi:aspartyl-tRNA(Asn)/glutamyl-tRNA(Gln) amidotransferase subunit C|nr:Asp-tRNA(Asn)/Glu-tRNA(Gln) amidotransferase subunit GatC [Oscillospiraceae bacterium]MDD3261764.1 Asp-tRNA(Asn)/Glu-tRNA(Gln) amidotransferase subunit GatC [Oscillospiraceae bacterium]
MVTHEEILKIAKLAKLEVAPEELDGLTKDMNEIISFADTIASVSAEEEAYADQNGLENVLRTDEVQPGLTCDEVLANAPDTDGSSFVVRPHA